MKVLLNSFNWKNISSTWVVGKQHIFSVALCGTVGLQGRQCHLSETWPRWDSEKFLPVIIFLNISAIHVFGNIPYIIIFQLQALDRKDKVFILNRVKFKNKQ